jgi:hypothetical protein
MIEDISQAWEILASKNCVESAHVGEAGTPSKVHAATRFLIEHASREEVLPQREHQSVGVRAAIVSWVLARSPEDLPSLYSYLSDESNIETMSGCLIESVWMPEWILGEMLQCKNHPVVSEMLWRIANDPELPDLQSQAFVAVQKKYANKQDREKLLQADDPRKIAAAIKTTPLEGQQEEERLRWYQSFMRAEATEIQEALVERLQEEPSSHGAALLQEIYMSSRDIGVQNAAFAAYCQREDGDLDWIKSLRLDNWYLRQQQMLFIIREAPQEALSRLSEALLDADSHAVELLAVFLDLKDPVLKEPSVGDVEARRPLLDQFVRKALLRGEINKWKGSAAYQIPAHLMRYSKERGLRECVPYLLQALQSDSIFSQQSAADALATLGDLSDAPSIERLLSESNAHARIAACKALSALHAIKSLAAMERSQQGAPDWAQKEMQPHIDLLRRINKN